MTVSGGNEPPTADFSYAVTGLSVSFSDLSSDPDGPIASWSWDFGEGSSPTDRDPSHTYLAPGIYDVLLTVTDDGGASDTFGQQVTVSDGGGLMAMYTDSMTATSTPDGGGWNAVVTMKIVDENGDPVVNATVTRQWRKGFYGSSSCTTDASGQCIVEQTGISDKTHWVTFTVDNVTHSAFTYNRAMNTVSSLRVDRPVRRNKPGQLLEDDVIALGHQMTQAAECVTQPAVPFDVQRISK